MKIRLRCPRDSLGWDSSDIWLSSYEETQDGFQTIYASNQKVVLSTFRNNILESTDFFYRLLLHSLNVFSHN